MSLPRGVLDTNTPSTQFSCPWTAPSHPTLFNPPSFCLVWRKAIYVTDSRKCICSLQYCFLCLSIHSVAAFKKLIWGVPDSEYRIVTRWCLRFLPTQTILWFCEMYEINICIWSGSNLIWGWVVWIWHRGIQCLFRAQFEIREKIWNPSLPL